MNNEQSSQKAPYQITLEAGKTYYWCRCGRSNNQPFCDGSHQGSDIEPMAYTAGETQSVWLCGCKQTGTEPFCDGTHNSL